MRAFFDDGSTRQQYRLAVFIDSAQARKREVKCKVDRHFIWIRSRLWPSSEAKASQRPSLMRSVREILGPQQPPGSDNARDPDRGRQPRIAVRFCILWVL